MPNKTSQALAMHLTTVCLRTPEGRVLGMIPRGQLPLPNSATLGHYLITEPALLLPKLYLRIKNKTGTYFVEGDQKTGL